MPQMQEELEAQEAQPQREAQAIQAKLQRQELIIVCL